MEKLTDEQSRHLPRQVVDRCQWLCSKERGFITQDEETTIWLAQELACALTRIETIRKILKRQLIDHKSVEAGVGMLSDFHDKWRHHAKKLEASQPCGHPPGCVVSAPSAKGMDTTSHCGWCAAEAERDIAQASLATVDLTPSEMRYEHAVWEKHSLTQIVEECAALRKKLAATDADLAGSIEFNRDVATENLKLEVERDSLRISITFLTEGVRKLEAINATIREKLKAAENDLGLERLTSDSYFRGMEEITRDQDNLRARFKAAQGLAKALETGRYSVYCPVCNSWNGLHPKDCQRQQALAAWKAAND